VGIDAEVVDWRALAGRSRRGLAHASPWARPGCAIVSIDFARQPGVLAGLAGAPWDALVVDEAHGAAGDSARRAAVEQLGRISRVIVLLTATPHGGDRQAFRALTNIGGGAPPLWFRHRREDVRPGARRRSRAWSLAPAPAERAVFDALRAYAAAVERRGAAESRLAMIVLKKRALSSAAALLRSLEHRRALLTGTGGAQLLLPLDGPPGEADAGDQALPLCLAAPGLSDPDTESATLTRLGVLAAAAARAPSKWRALDRLIRRTSESVLVFTEYRDSLDALAAHLSTRASVDVLHGGLSRPDRTSAVDRFLSGRTRVLVATDVAAEGLNLQARCRLVIDLELPWSPARLEQRVGRLDRLGQKRTVHEWRLMGARGHEAAVVAALRRRMDAIQADLPRPVEGTAPAVAAPPTAGEPRPAWRVPALHASPPAVLSALARWRTMRPRTDAPRTLSPARLAAPRYVRARRSRWPGCGVVLVFTVTPRAAIESHRHVAVHVSMACLPDGSPERWLPQVVTAAAPVASAVTRAPAALVRRLLHRERAIRQSGTGRRGQRWQPSLFDRRAERAVAAAAGSAADFLRACDERIADLEAARDHPAILSPVLALLID
jgi:hypothetical protein